MWLTWIRLERPKDYEIVRERLSTVEAPRIHVEFDGTGFIDIRVCEISGDADTATRMALRTVNGILRRHRLRARPISVATRPAGAVEPFPDIVGLSEIAKLLDLSKPRVSQLTKKKNFPAPIATLAMGPVFAKRAIREYLDNESGTTPFSATSRWA